MTTKREPPYIWLNEPYMEWLTSQIEVRYRNFRNEDYTDLFAAFWSREFVWTVPNDGNRLADGLELRYFFLIDENVRFNRRGPSEADVARFRAQPCSFLEVLVALSRRLEFATEMSGPWWAWTLIENINLAMYRNPITPEIREGVDEAIDKLIFRTYNWKGEGGFFPLKYPQKNQLDVEIWYQMAAYLNERAHPIF
jgi:hypothetical protein